MTRRTPTIGRGASAMRLGRAALTIRVPLARAAGVISDSPEGPA